MKATIVQILELVLAIAVIGCLAVHPGILAIVFMVFCLLAVS